MKLKNYQEKAQINIVNLAKLDYAFKYQKYISHYYASCNI